jgi:hypothetical protein
MSSAEKAGRSNLSSLEAPFSAFQDLSPTEYYGLVTDEINFNHLSDLYRLSQTELVVIQESTELNGDAILRDFFGKDHYRELFDVGDEGAIDTKAFDTDGTFSYAYDDSDIIYPDRVLNSYPVYPLTESGLALYCRARERTLAEMSGSKLIRKEMKDQLRDYKRAMQTGIYRKARAFDTDKHIHARIQNIFPTSSPAQTRYRNLIAQRHQNLGRHSQDHAHHDRRPYRISV